MSYWQQLAALGSAGMVLLFPFWLYAEYRKARHAQRELTRLIEVGLVMVIIGVAGSLWTS